MASACVASFGLNPERGVRGTDVGGDRRALLLLLVMNAAASCCCDVRAPLLAPHSRVSWGYDVSLAAEKKEPLCVRRSANRSCRRAVCESRAAEGAE